MLRRGSVSDAYSVRQNRSRSVVVKADGDGVDGCFVVGEESVVEICRMRVRVWSEMLKFEACVMQNSVSMCFWDLQPTSTWRNTE